MKDRASRPAYRQQALSLAMAVLVAWLGVSCAGVSAPEVAPGAASPAPAVAVRQILVTFTPRPALEIPRAGSSARVYRGGEGYRTSSRSLRLARQLARDYGLREVAQWPIRPLGVHCVVYEVAVGVQAAEVMARLERDRRVESVQPLQLFSLESGIAYDDPYLELQHGVAELGLEEAHRWASGAGVRVAVVDTGVDLSHPELAGRIVEARDFVTDQPGALPPDRHGTAVAGVIASAANNGIGIVGVAPGVEILALRGCWPRAAGSAEALCSSFTLAKALSFVIEARPEVLNLSLDGPRDPLLERLLRLALRRGILVVAARGESAEAGFPSGVEGVLAVHAAPFPTRADGRRAAAGELAAPGREILTTVPEGRFDFLSGSSLAAAQVSGVAALLLERRRLAPAAVLAVLRSTARPATPAGSEPPQVDACAALARVVAGVRCS